MMGNGLNVSERIHWGNLNEIPEIYINLFNPEEINWDMGKAFFLTDQDTDVLRELMNNDFWKIILESQENSLRVYMHERLYNYVMYWSSSQEFAEEEYNEAIGLMKEMHAAGRLIFIAVNSPISLVLTPKKTVEVMPLYSGHAPGSLMLLFEVSEMSGNEVRLAEPLRVLYTGQCRLTLKDFRRLPALFHDGNQQAPKLLSKVYIDSTHCVPEVRELPARGDVIFSLIEFLGGVMSNDANMRFEFISSEKGGLVRVFYHLADELCEAVHVPTNLAKMWGGIPEIYGRFKPALSKDFVSHFHYDCGPEMDHEGCLGAAEDWGLTFDVTRVILSAEGRSNWQESTKSVFQPSGDEIRGLYVSNFSRFELARFVKKLNVEPTRVLPLFKPTGVSAEQVQNMMMATVASVEEEPVFLQKEVSGSWYDFSNTKEEQLRADIQIQPPVFFHDA